MALSAYGLLASYAGEALIAGFDFNTGKDPSNGFVQYQGRDEAAEANLWSIDQDTNAVILGVDSINTFADGAGRPSIRIESKESYNHGLFIGDFGHMPPSQCGVWPAFWALGSKWPDYGEIDIIEGANTAQRNLISAHTGGSCVLTQTDQGPNATTAAVLGSLQNAQCGPGEFNVGCSYAAPADKESYGDAFNAIGGGVYAMEWTSAAVKVWHFPRGRVPADVTLKTPDPSLWGPPDAVFGGAGSACDIDSHFRDMRLVLNINFCGDYGSFTWATNGVCSSRASSCTDFVANNPDAFSETFWEVNYIDVYGLGSPDEPAATTTTTTTSQSTRTVTLRPRASAPGVVALEKLAIASSAAVEHAAASSSSSSSMAGRLPTSTSAAMGADITNVPRIGNYSFIGCMESLDGFIGFRQPISNTTAMTPSRCVAACRGKKYAGVFDRTCYCADELSGDVKALADISDCDIPCPGDRTLACGGYACIDQADDDDEQGTTMPSNSTLHLARLLRRDASPDILLTMYALLVDEPEPAPAPGQGGPAGVERVTITSTVTYTTVCPSHPASLVPTTYVAVVTADCSYGEKPSVPMVTQVVPCHACGPAGQSTVTVTVPAGAVVQTAAPSVVPGIAPDVRAAAPSLSAAAMPLWVVGGVSLVSFVFAVFL